MRIAITGPSGSGKTTLAAELARRYGLRHVEITEDDTKRINRIIRRGDSVAPFYEAEFGPHPYRVAV